MLARSTPLKRTGLKRYPEKPTKRHPKPNGPDVLTVAKVLRRASRDDQIHCEVCGIWVFGVRGLCWSIHHRRGREGRRTDNRVENLLVVCGSDNVSGCHGRIHSRRSESRPNGWWLSRISNEDPAAIPLLIDNGSRWVYLTGDGYADNPPLAGVA